MKNFSIKKFAAVLAASLMVLSLAACGEKPVTTSEAPVSTEAPETTPEATEPETTAEPVEPFGEEDLVLVVDGVELSLRMDFVPVKDKILGGNYDEQVGQACVGGGNDRAYYYDGDAVSIYTVGSASGEQTIYDIYITLLEGYATPKGAVIGKTTRDEVIELYGEPSSTFPASERYTLDDKLELIFGFDGDILSSVGLHDNEVQ